MASRQGTPRVGGSWSCCGDCRVDPSEPRGVFFQSEFVVGLGFESVLVTYRWDGI